MSIRSLGDCGLSEDAAAKQQRSSFPSSALILIHKKIRRIAKFRNRRHGICASLLTLSV